MSLEYLQIRRAGEPALYPESRMATFGPLKITKLKFNMHEQLRDSRMHDKWRVCHRNGIDLRQYHLLQHPPSLAHCLMQANPPLTPDPP
jgi:hypothetical protein